MENPFAIVGGEEIVSGFRALGFNVYAGIDDAVKNNAAVCLVQDDVYRADLDKILGYRDRALPVFIPFSKTGGMETLGNIIKDIRLRATGTL